VAFQWHKIRRTLNDISPSLTTDLEGPLSAAAAAMSALDAASAGAAIPDDVDLAAQMLALGSSAKQISDLLVLRYFSHVQSDERVVAS
jgi:hypothetical protein